MFRLACALSWFYSICNSMQYCIIAAASCMLCTVLRYILVQLHRRCSGGFGRHFLPLRGAIAMSECRDADGHTCNPYESYIINRLPDRMDGGCTIHEYYSIFVFYV